jgi:Protein of unknown function (DUF2905)
MPFSTRAVRWHSRVRDARAFRIENEQNCLAAAKRNPAILHHGDDLETENVVIKLFCGVEIARINGGLAQLTEPHRRRLTATDVAGKGRLRLTSQETKLDRDMQEFGKLLVGLGGLVLLLGLALWSGFGAGWLGRLPGDIRIEREHSVFYFPIVTCIIISIVLSLLFSFFRR